MSDALIREICGQIKENGKRLRCLPVLPSRSRELWERRRLEQAQQILTGELQRLALRAGPAQIDGETA